MTADDTAMLPLYNSYTDDLLGVVTLDDIRQLSSVDDTIDNVDNLFPSTANLNWPAGITMGSTQSSFFFLTPLATATHHEVSSPSLHFSPQTPTAHLTSLHLSNLYRHLHDTTPQTTDTISTGKFYS